MGRLLLLLLALQAYRPGPQVLNFTSQVDASEQPYAIYLPNDLDATRRYPLVLSLHGDGSSHQMNLRRVFGRGTLPLLRRDFPALPGFDFIVVSPLARGSLGYQGIAEQDIYDLLEEIKRRFPVDEDRVYLTGIAMGGGGALWLGLTRPDLWAAVAPVCAIPPDDAAELAGNALNLPVRLFHGDRDPAVPVASSRGLHKRFLELQVKAEYIEYPGVRHNAWEPAYKGAAIFDWFAAHRRQRFPERVRFTARAYKYSSAYWVRLDAFDPSSPASIDARFTGRNTLAVTTSNLTGFTLHLADHPRVAAGAPLALAIDGTRLKARAAKALSFRRTAAGWRAGLAEPPPGGKRRGAEGPLSEAIAARHIYVYGTADNPAEAELERRRQEARTAAEWSTPQLRVPVSFSVKADDEVTRYDIETSNLVLFGTRETNALIARFAARFPMRLERSAADYGLVFIAPLEGGRYAVVNSGLPWWTGAGESGRAGLDRRAPPFRVLQTFPDYVLFKGSLANVLAEGRFDSRWRLTQEAAAQINAAGTVVVAPDAAR